MTYNQRQLLSQLTIFCRAKQTALLLREQHGIGGANDLAPTQVAGMALESFGGLAYVSIEGDDIQESGGPLASLRGDNIDQNVGYSTVGLRAATTMHWGAMQVVPHVSAAWQHTFDGVTPDASLAFASTGIGFTVYGVPLAEDTALIDAGLDLSLGERTSEWPIS